MVRTSYLGLFTYAAAALASELHPHAVRAAAATCTPTAGGSSNIDDTPAIVSAINACPSGTIVIPKGKTYYIGSQLQFTGCAGCTLQIDGTLQVTTNFTYWNGKGAIIMIKSIADATILSSTGGGVVDGAGQASWDYIVNNDTSYARPYLFQISGSTGVKMTNLTIRNAPSFHVVTNGNSKSIYYGNITLHSVSTSANVAHNTDGFDVGPASYVTLENLHVTNDDDCVVLKPGASYIAARDITCIGSHGLSVGSLGSGSGKNDTVTNSIFERAVMNGATKAAGIKIYPGGPSHGTGTVVNVTWKDVVCQSCDYAIQIQQCYGDTTSYCTEYPSTGHISGVLFQNFTGTTSGNYKNTIANVDCPGNGTCGVQISGLTAKSPSGGSTVLCANTPSNLGVTCTSGASG
ncbi:glycoside hydrolase family 28 protein [Diplogelasinospora grovesii]|uniref:Glycoside hydrolase family 28 protein n=1 Tax=Diplogelasinospora grovesii TaxID=303347 RepID=A0AAN6S532_9PEZI|nr:glycoside hydrolase family 28 protein [Diplogelasinospora grovesii]